MYIPIYIHIYTHTCRLGTALSVGARFHSSKIQISEVAK